MKIIIPISIFLGICFSALGQDEIILKSTGKPFDYGIEILKVTADSIYYKAFWKKKVLPLTDVLSYHIIPKDSTLITKAKNSFFVEMGGNGGARLYGGSPFLPYLSINYDRILSGDFKTVKTSLRFGSNIPVKDFDTKKSPNITSTHVSNIMLNLIFGRKPFHLELGFGGSLIYFNSNYKTAYCAFTSFLGVRCQNYKKGIIASIGISPSIGPFDGLLPFRDYPRFSTSDEYMGPMLGTSVGICF